MSTVLVAAAVVCNEGTILLTKRPPGTHLGGFWEFPGGKLERGESPEEALVRECKEECGIDIEVDCIFDVIFHRYPEKEVLLLFYRCHLLTGEVQHIEVADHHWCKPEQLSDYNLPPADVPIVEKLQNATYVHPT